MNVALHTDFMKSRIKAEESADWLLPFIGDKKRVRLLLSTVSVTSSNTNSNTTILVLVTTSTTSV